MKQEAARIAGAIQGAGYSREESRAIRAGVQQGMEIWLRQQNERARELDKREKKVRASLRHSENAVPHQTALMESHSGRQPFPMVSYLPWGLLLMSWLAFAIYYFRY